MLTTDPASKSVATQAPDDAMSEVVALFRQIKENSGRAAELGFQLDDLIRKLPAELKDLVRQQDEDWLSEAIAAAEPLLISRLMGTEVEE